MRQGMHDPVSLRYAQGYAVSIGYAQGYAWQMDRPEMQLLIPARLKENKETLFGNMQDIYSFHAKSEPTHDAS